MNPPSSSFKYFAAVKEEKKFRNFGMVLGAVGAFDVFCVWLMPTIVQTSCVLAAICHFAISWCVVPTPNAVSWHTVVPPSLKACPLSGVQSTRSLSSGWA